jgi:hypothetical protein
MIGSDSNSDSNHTCHRIGLKTFMLGLPLVAPLIAIDTFIDGKEVGSDLSKSFGHPGLLGYILITLLSLIFITVSYREYKNLSFDPYADDADHNPKNSGKPCI